MDIRDDSDSTLPSLEVSLDSADCAPELLLTIVFHPDISRIGQFAVLPRSRSQHLLGRNSLIFSSPGLDGSPLEDRHISREALILERSGKSLKLRRRPDSCRCQVAGKELTGERKLGLAELSTGVPILLAHSVVLLLSLSSKPSGESFTDCGLLGSSAVMCHLRKQIAQIARSDLDVLLLGETGTGKEVVAAAIHSAGPCSSVPMVPVNMAAIPGPLAAAALFGSARGAFTGADRSKTGYFQQAQGSTLFLDEIGDAPEEVQPQLLRALQQREVQAVGGAISRVELRVISATDARVDEETTGFKSALRHRLGALEVMLPPLRDHPADIGELLRHYLGEAMTGAGRAGLLPSIDSEQRQIAAWASLFYQALGYGWPGNVRQLINVCHQIAVASESGLLVPAGILAQFSAGHSVAHVQEHPGGYRSLLEVSEEEFDRAMRERHHEVAGVARLLGVSRQSIYRRRDSSGIYRKVSDIADSELQDAVRECAGDALAAAQLLRVSASGLRSRMRRTPPG